MNKRDITSNIIEQLFDEGYETIHGRPDVIIFGEYHTYREHTREQARSVLRNRPEFILCESLNNKSVERTADFLEIHKFLSVSEILTKLGIPLSLMKKPEIIEFLTTEAQFLSDFLKNADKTAISEIPSNFYDLFRTPLYDLPIPAHTALISFIQDCLDQWRAQMIDLDADPTIIKNISFMETVLDIILKYKLSESRIAPLCHAAAQVNAKLAGCDIDKSNCPQLNPEILAEGDTEKILQFLKDQGDYILDKNREREKTMGERIAFFSKIRKTDQPLIAVIGAAHLLPESEIHEILKDSRIKYRCIKQRKAFFPDQGQKIKDTTYSVRSGLKNK